MAKAVMAEGVPIVLALQDVEFKDQGDDYQSLRFAKAVANSAFTSKRYRDMFDIESTVIHPIMRESDYSVENTGKSVTFINPDPRKGLNIVIDVAQRCPSIPFLFVDGWPIDPEVRGHLAKRLASMPNVTYSRSVLDMRCVYRETRVLFAPSQWEEGYGRVATEAQFSGIPVVASNRGGLPEAVGPGGVILAADAPLEAWVDAVQSVWHDETRYRELSLAARSYSRRPQLDPDTQFALWESTLAAAATSHES
ncbi:MAG: glycosyltransferase [Novosphingobium sp.]